VVGVNNSLFEIPDASGPACFSTPDARGHLAVVFGSVSEDPAVARMSDQKLPTDEK
jgi:hypothetical protein